MSKHEQPPFRMVLDKGRLVPASAYDQERLLTWRNGAEVNVRFVEDRSRWGVRKWFAVLNRAVKECPTPWKTTAEASEAIKLALGIVNLTKTVGGAWMQYPKSLTELTDPELEEAVEQMLAVMYRVTGIDPDDWRKQIADIGKDKQDPGSAPLEPEPEAGAIEAREEPVAAPASELSEADVRWLVPTARQMWAFAFTGEPARVKAVAKSIIEDTPADIGKLAREKAGSIRVHCLAVAADLHLANTNRRLVAGIAGISEAELREVET